MVEAKVTLDWGIYLPQRDFLIRKDDHKLAKPYKRKDGRWSLQVRVGSSLDGTPQYKTIYGNSKQETIQKAALLTAQVVQGNYVRPNALTISQFLADWIENLDSVKPNTKISYEGLIRNHINPSIGKIQLQKLKPLHVQKMLNSLKDKGLSPRTRQYIYAVLNSALNQAVRWELLLTNPCPAVDRPKVPRHKIAPLTAEQAKRFLDVALENEDRFYAVFLLAVTTGMRAGELLGLQWEDIDFDGSCLAVRHTLNRKTKTLGEPKTKSARRVVKLSKLAIVTLKKHKVRQAEQRLRAGKRWNTACDLDLVFTTSVGTPVDHSHLVQRHFNPILKKAGLPMIRFHDLRHTAATLLLKSGVHAKIVQEMLGHSTISMTLDTYSHVLPSMQVEAAHKMDNLFQENHLVYSAR